MMRLRLHLYGTIRPRLLKWAELLEPALRPIFDHPDDAAFWSIVAQLRAEGAHGPYLFAAAAWRLAFQEAGAWDAAMLLGFDRTFVAAWAWTLAPLSDATITEQAGAIARRLVRWLVPMDMVNGAPLALIARVFQVAALITAGLLLAGLLPILL